MLIINTQMPFLLLEFANTKEKMNQSLIMRIRLCDWNWETTTTTTITTTTKNLVCQSCNRTPTTGSILFLPTELNLGALNRPILLILCSYIILPHTFLNGDSNASLSKQFVALLSSPTQWPVWFSHPPTHAGEFYHVCWEECEGFTLTTQSSLPSKMLSNFKLQLQPLGCKFE